MKVALVASGFLPGCGALEQRVDRLAEGLVERGADVEILTQTAGGSPSALLTPYGARVRRFPFPGAPRFFLVPAFWDQLRRSAAHADIVDIHTADPSLALAVSARAPRRAVLTPYGSLERFARWPQSRMTRAALARAGLVVCATEVDRQALAAHFPEALPRSTVVPSGADTRELDAARAYSASGPVVLAVGPLRRVQPLA